MLTPPLEPARRRAALAAGALVPAFMWGSGVALRGLGGQAVAIAAVVAGALGLCWALWVVGRSSFGSFHGRVAPWALLVLIVWPMGSMLLPLATGGGWPADATLALLHVAVLVVGGLLHARTAAARAAPEARRWSWPAVEVDVPRRRLLAAVPAAGEWSSLVTAAAGSSALYGALQVQFEAPVRLLLVLVLVNAIAFYLYAAPLGRQLGQAWVLWRFERAHPGAAFSHEALPELERLRQRSWLFRRRG